MFVSLRGNPFKSELDSLQADAMGVGDLALSSCHCQMSPSSVRRGTKSKLELNKSPRTTEKLGL